MDVKGEVLLQLFNKNKLRNGTKTLSFQNKKNLDLLLIQKTYVINSRPKPQPFINKL